MTANRAASVLARLKNRARADGEDLQYVLVRYANERLLYRLSVSEAGRAFVLKGATLFLGWHGRVHRVTRDIDLLGFGDPSPAHLEEVFRAVAAHPFEDDAVVFDPASVRAEPIREGMAYGGVRVTIRGRLDRADLAVQVDVGFGDAVEPAPVVMDLPTLLDLPAPRLRAYPREVVIAEKVEAMVRLGRENSRMKDFYDVWLLLRTVPADERLAATLRATFARRGTPLPIEVPDAWSDAFASDPMKRTQWSAFLRRALTAEQPSLGEVVGVLRERLGACVGITAPR